VGGERGSIDTERDPRGFVLEFYTEEGIWCIVGNNTPVCFIRDQLKSTFGRFLPVTKGRFWPRVCKNAPNLIVLGH